MDLSHESCFSINLSDLSLFAPSIMSIKLSNPRYVMEPACYVFYLYIEEKTLIKFYKTKKLTHVLRRLLKYIFKQNPSATYDAIFWAKLGVSTVGRSIKL